MAYYGKEVYKVLAKQRGKSERSTGAVGKSRGPRDLRELVVEP